MPSKISFKLQSAIEYMSSYSWALIILVLVLIIFFLIFAHAINTTYSSSYCYISTSFKCYQLLISTNSIGVTSLLVFTNDLGRTIYFQQKSPFSISITPTGNYISGSCAPLTATPGTSITCVAYLPGYEPAYGTQLEPEFFFNYSECIASSCTSANLQKLSTAGSAVSYAYPVNTILLTSTTSTSTSSTSAPSSSLTTIKTTTPTTIQTTVLPPPKIPTTTIPTTISTTTSTTTHTTISTTITTTSTSTTTSTTSTTTSTSTTTVVPSIVYPPSPTNYNPPTYLYYFGGITGATFWGWGGTVQYLGELINPSASIYAKMVGNDPYGFDLGFVGIYSNGQLLYHSDPNVNGRLTSWYITTAYPVTPGYQGGTGGANCLGNIPYCLGDIDPRQYYFAVPPEGLSCPTFQSYVICVGGNLYSYTTSGGEPNRQNFIINDVFFNMLTASGLSSWIQTTNYPIGVSGANCVTTSTTQGFSGDYIYCVGSTNAYPSQDTSLSYYAQIYVNSNGQVTGLSPWVQTNSYPASSPATCVTEFGNIYCAGGSQTQATIRYTAYCERDYYNFGYPRCVKWGYTSTTVYTTAQTSTGYYASLSSDGIGQWQATNGYVFNPSSSTAQCSLLNSYYICIYGSSTLETSLSPSGMSPWENIGSGIHTDNPVINSACVIPGYNYQVICLGGDDVDSGGAGHIEATTYTANINPPAYSISGWSYSTSGSSTTTFSNLFVPVESGKLIEQINPIGSTLYATPDYTYSGTTPGVTSIPLGGGIDIVAQPFGGSPPYTYQWLYKAPGWTNYVLIPGATSQTYAFVPPLNNPTGTYQFIANIQDSGQLYSGQIYGVTQQEISTPPISITVT